MKTKSDLQICLLLLLTVIRSLAASEDNETSADLDGKRGFRVKAIQGEEQGDYSSTIVIICATILAVTVVIAITVIATVFLIVKRKQRVEEERAEEERNDLYGTYYQGVEYNIVIDNNPRYNEDEGNADAAVTTDKNTSFRGVEYSVTDENVRIL